MTNIIGDPFIQPLGFEGEAFVFKLVFPVYGVWDDTGPEFTGIDYKHGAIFKVRAEDLPRYIGSAELLHIDLGQFLRGHNKDKPHDTES